MSDAERASWGIPPPAGLHGAEAVVAWPVVAIEAECSAEPPTDALSRLVLRMVSAGETTASRGARVSGLSEELVQAVLDDLHSGKRVRRDREGTYSLTDEGEQIASGGEAPLPARTAWFLLCGRTGAFLPIRYWEELPADKRWTGAVEAARSSAVVASDPILGGRLRAVAHWCELADGYRADDSAAEPPPDFEEFVDESEGVVNLGQGGFRDADVEEEQYVDGPDVALTGATRERSLLLGLRAGLRPGELCVDGPSLGGDGRFFVERLVDSSEPQIRDLCDRLLRRSERSAAEEAVRAADSAVREQLDLERYPWGALSDLPERLQEEVEEAESMWFRLRAGTGRPHEVLGSYRKVFELVVAMALPGESERARRAVRRIPSDPKSQEDWIRARSWLAPFHRSSVARAVHELSSRSSWQRVPSTARHGQVLLCLLALAAELDPETLDDAVRCWCSPLLHRLEELVELLRALHAGAHPDACQVEDASVSRDRVQLVIAAFYPRREDG